MVSSVAQILKNAAVFIFLCSANLVTTPSVEAPPGEHLTLTCNVTYLSPDHLNASMPVVIMWSTNLTEVDVSDQVLQNGAQLVYSTLTLADVDSRHCGVYSCLVIDNFTDLDGNTTVNVNTGIVLSVGQLG